MQDPRALPELLGRRDCKALLVIKEMLVRKGLPAQQDLLVLKVCKEFKE